MIKKILVINLLVLAFSICGYGENNYVGPQIFPAEMVIRQEINNNNRFYRTYEFSFKPCNDNAVWSTEANRCECKDTFVKNASNQCVCHDENMEIVEGRCVCLFGFETINEGQGCQLICPDDHELIAGVCYRTTPTCKDGKVFDKNLKKCVADNLDDCEDGQVFDSDLNKCVDFNLITGDGGGGCSLGGNLANPLNLILLLSFLIPAFKRKK
jgi:hypothetical protein